MIRDIWAYQICTFSSHVSNSIWAALLGNFEAALLLLQRGADPLLRDDDGFCALDHAVHDIYGKRALKTGCESTANVTIILVL